MNNDTRNVFFNRNYRLVFFGALVSELGAILYSFAVSFYILEITDNNAFLQGLYLALCGGMLLLATPVGGVLGDRFNKAKIMFLCDYMKGGIIVLATVLDPVRRGHSGQRRQRRLLPRRRRSASSHRGGGKAPAGQRLLLH